MEKIMRFVVLVSAGLGVTCLVSFAAMSNSTNQTRTISEAPFGKMPDGTPVKIYTLRNSSGTEARIMTYGGIVVSLKVPDKSGSFDDVVLGYDNFDGYVKSNPFFGTIVGRYGNRIGGAKFTLDGKVYTLAVNNGPNSLHGGLKGFDKVVWRDKSSVTPLGPALGLTYLSKDGEEGFPGNLKVTAVYTLTDDNGLRLDFTATTDKPTICNLTQHSYFNLAGEGNGDILGHEVYFNSDKITPVDKDLIPSGEFKSVAGTPFDFRKPTTIGAHINDDDEQLKFGHGYDHNWVVNKPLGKLGMQARVYEPTSGRVMEVLSTEPGLQFYTANWLDGTTPCKGGKVYRPRTAFCIEPQHYPDSPNKPGFPSVVVRPGEVCKSTIIYRFSVK
jgi:aldose 1-epimerase